MFKKHEIEVDLFNVPKTIKIKDKVTYYNEEYDCTIIEIDQKKEEINDYLELDDNILYNNKIKDYIGNTIYILQYPSYYEKQRLAVSYGVLKSRFDEEYNFNHYCSTEKGSLRLTYFKYI